MSQDDLLKVLTDITMADSLSYWIVGALTALVFVVMRAMLPVKSLAIVFAPALFWGGLAGIYAANQLRFFVSSDRSAQIVATSAIGMIAALIVVILLARLIDMVTRIRTPLTNDRRARV